MIRSYTECIRNFYMNHENSLTYCKVSYIVLNKSVKRKVSEGKGVKKGECFVMTKFIEARELIYKDRVIKIPTSKTFTSTTECHILLTYNILYCCGMVK